MFSSKRLKALGGVALLDPKFHCAGVVGEFISLYLQTEVMAKKIQNYYRTDKNKADLDKIQIQVLKASLKHFSLPFNDSDVSLIFKGGEGLVGKKSARQLRNGYLHSLSPSDKNEIIHKAQQYVAIMEKFLLLYKR
jgi:hypothetical protein